MHDPLLNLTKKFRRAKATRNYARAKVNSPNRGSMSIELTRARDVTRTLQRALPYIHTYTFRRTCGLVGDPRHVTPRDIHLTSAIKTNILRPRRVRRSARRVRYTAHTAFPTARLIPALPRFRFLRSCEIGKVPSYALGGRTASGRIINRPL